MPSAANTPEAPVLTWNGLPEGPCVALAHGSGAPQDSPFMESLATGLASRGLRVARFEFPYMQKRRVDGRKRAPDRQARLLACWQQVVEQLPRPFAIGGKSMGGRMASMMADDCQPRALVVFGFPFHPAGKPDRLRVDHLQTLQTPTLILQGERDAFGKREEVEGYLEQTWLASSIRFAWLPDGDHGFKPRKRSGYTEEQNSETAIETAAKFLKRRLA